MSKASISFRYPYNGDLYTAEGPRRIRVEHANEFGYFDDCGRWLDGPLRSADPCFCRFLSSSWIVEQNLEQFYPVRPPSRSTLQGPNSVSEQELPSLGKGVRNE